MTGFLAGYGGYSFEECNDLVSVRESVGLCSVLIVFIACVYLCVCRLKCGLVSDYVFPWGTKVQSCIYE